MQPSLHEDIRQVTEGVAPVLEVLLDGSTEVNVNRAENCAFVATSAPSRRRAKHAARRTRAASDREPAPPRVELMSKTEVSAAMRKAPRRTAPPDVDLSLFVQLAQDLDAPVRERALARIGR